MIEHIVDQLWRGKHLSMVDGPLSRFHVSLCLLLMVLCGIHSLRKVGSTSFAIHGFGCLFQKLVQVRSLEESVTVGWIPVHRDVASCSPFANSVLGDAQVFRCCGGVWVLGQLVGHGTRSPLCSRSFTMRADYQTLHGFNITPQFFPNSGQWSEIIEIPAELWPERA
jgi:hypothetical protein